MVTAKPRKKGKSMGSWLWNKIIPSPGKEVGAMDYPAIDKAKKARARRKKAMEDMFK